MNIVLIKSRAEELDKARSRLRNLELQRSLLNFKGHREPLLVSIGSIRLEVTESDRDYTQKVKRGYEMIHLGAIKVSEVAIDKAKEEVKSLEVELRLLVGKA